MSDDDWLTSQPDPNEFPKLRQPSAASRQPAVGGYPSLQEAAAQPRASGGYQSAEEPPVNGGVQAPRFLQRPADSGDNRVSILDKAPPMTLKQKEAEYAAARARIFGSKAGAGGKGDGPQQGARGRGPQQQYDAGRNGRGQVGRGTGTLQGRSAGGGGGGSGRGRRGCADDGDPDYDRNPAKFAVRLAPTDSAPDDWLDQEPWPDQENEHGPESRFVPKTYESEFPTL